MYAIVEIAGQQFKVQQDQKLYVHRLEGAVDSKIDFDKVLLIDNDGKVKVGAPVISGAKVSAKIIQHLKDDKVIVFKKKRRKGYQKSNGHRQQLTQILVQGILGKGETLKDEIKVEKKAPKAEAPVVEVKAKKAAPKKAAAKKEAAPAKKAAPKKAAKKAAK